MCLVYVRCVQDEGWMHGRCRSAVGQLWVSCGSGAGQLWVALAVRERGGRSRGAGEQGSEGGRSRG